VTIALLTPINLNGIDAIVTDPCYYRGSEHMIHEVKKIQQGGEWKMEIQRAEMGAFGERVVELAVVHSSYTIDDEAILSGTAGVDSGQMSICGDMDAERFGNPDDYGPGGFDPEGNSGLFNYQGACDITINRADGAGVLCDVMAVSSTGCGDGVYPIFVWRNASGIATKIAVDFRDLEEDEEDEDGL
jgi:hypothetical protein